MSQDASTRTKLLQPSDASPFSPESLGDVTDAGSFPVESYADRLMDDLFGDVERLLDSSAKLATEPVRVEPSAPLSKGSALDSLVDLVSPLMRRPPDVDGALTASEQEVDALLANRETVERSLTQSPSSAQLSQPARSYDRLLLGVGCLSIVATLGVWWINHQATRPPVPVAVVPQVPAGNAAPQNPAANDQFVNYLQQALKAIEQQQAGSPSVATSGTTNLPLVPPGRPTIQPPATSPATPGNAARPSTGLSRLYVPVYQVPQAQPGSPAVAPLPPVNPPVAVRPPIPLSMPGIPKKLVGVLELGDRSAALIEINGVTQRYRIGESVGTSGWSLVEVSKDQAVLRRNGEVRSIFIGQNF
ncbi:MAG: type II secretion system protein N [Stenomitos frigidus ULC029]